MGDKQAERSNGGDQAALWNGPSGQAWVAQQALLDRMLQPLEALLVSAVDAGTVQHVLDVGCGAGATTLALARIIGARGHCTGIDISGPLVDVARSRAQREGVPAAFVHADAQTHAFAPGSFDVIVSRLGVMFFTDPVAAFANLRRAATAGAMLHCIAWRGAAENPFMTTAERAAAALLPNLPPRQPGGPGQFAFGDRQLVRSILEDSGWTAIDITPIDVACALPARALEDYFTNLGPVGLALRDEDAGTRARVVEVVGNAFRPYVHGQTVHFTAACWMITARAPAGSKAEETGCHG
ncbi:class I SAM-dependent methyltransferase [Cupriavidus consociatus]|uniref:class I SAM-dependent methyltransferase n=1 Tax=Cupriavidus consociatus TaxID=2821357 RepID=UPI001AE350A9|nr:MULTISPECIES: class I SAM-dependent methyltransferase [unclassified Cupriavidus]MBP0622010.1 class I SAM-dependent methyltransferase [Cupriavidus sp. LEh25]MDK2658686.1 class I SAM-dependent methyltransferase [Cupriavidus sp. LEh21]